MLQKDINADGLSRLILYIGLIPVSVIHGQWGLVHSAWNTQTLNDFHFDQMTTQQSFIEAVEYFIPEAGLQSWL